jgi:hypothetical protein
MKRTFKTAKMGDLPTFGAFDSFDPFKVFEAFFKDDPNKEDLFGGHFSHGSMHDLYRDIR